MLENVAVTRLILAFGVLLAIGSGDICLAGEATVTVQRLEAEGSHAIGAKELTALIKNKTVVYIRLDTGAQEPVFYGRRRVENGRSTEYEIGDSGIIETVDDEERALSFYRFKGRGYACIDLNCPYLFIVKSGASGDMSGAAKSPRL